MVRPKKHLGQHFLHDQRIAQNIVAALPAQARRILEIGPGTGILTKHLLENTDLLLKCIEIDSESVAHLRKAFALAPADLIQGDFLQLDLAALFNQPFWIIGNFPYNISSQILFRVYDNMELIEGLVGMFQREVARRVVAGPGSKEYGIPSVLLQTYFHIEYLFTVPEGSFFPPPSVKSAVIRLTPHPPQASLCQKSHLTRIVKAAFNQRRKTLRNALRSIGIQPDHIPADLAGLRAEQLTIKDFQCLVASTSRDLT